MSPLALPTPAKVIATARGAPIRDEPWRATAMCEPNRPDMAKTCGLCGYSAKDPADFDQHMRRVHRWDQVQAKPGIVRDNAVITIVVTLTVLLWAPIFSLGTVHGVLSFLVMFAVVLRFCGPRVLLTALGIIAAIYAALLAFAFVFVLLNGG